MSIEINELLVRIEVTGNQPERGTARPGRQPKPDAKQREALIAECVERVMEIMRQREER